MTRSGWSVGVASGASGEAPRLSRRRARRADVAAWLWRSRFVGYLWMVLLVVAATGCQGGDAASERARPLHVASSPVEIERTPVWTLQLCGEVPGLGGLCPVDIPRRAGGGELQVTRISTTPRYPVSYLTLSSGDEWFGRPRRNRPPKFSSTTVMAGELDRLYPHCWPAAHAVAVDPNHVRLSSERRRPISFGTRRWGGLVGTLSLTPSRRCTTWGQETLVFRWQAAGAQRAVALHAWEPFSETAPTLRYLVESIGRDAPASGDWFTTACIGLAGLKPACPTWIPPARSNFFTMSYLPHQAQPGVTAFLSAEWSGARPRPERNRPPGFLHVEVRAGRPRPAPDGVVVQPHDGLMANRRYEDTRAVSFGPANWGGHAGLLVLGDCFGNHLCFRWRQHGVEYQIDLHGWEPFTQTVDTLRRIVRSTP